MAQFLMWICRLLLGIVLTTSCGTDVPKIEITPFSELLWPMPSEAPTCTPWSQTFALPSLAPITGRLRMDLSSVLIPMGELERVEVRVLNTDSSLDFSATGMLTLSPLPGMEIISSTDILAGYGELVLRFDKKRKFALQLSLENDSREGRIEISAYKPRIPIWNLRVDPTLLSAISSSPRQRIKIDAVLKIGEKTHRIRMRIHGGASRSFPKKSFRLDLLGSALDSGETNVVLRSEYNDKTMLRTYLAYEFFRNGTMIPTPETQYVHLRINNRYYGLMLHVERIDAHFLDQRGFDPEGNLYEADPPPGLTVPGGNLTVLNSLLEYYQVYQWHTGSGAWKDLIEFIEFTLIFPDRAFDQVIAQEVRLDDYIPYLAMMAVLQNHEHIRKNFYIYRDPSAADPGWLMFPWDLDMTMGHLWSEVDGVFDERIISHEDLFVGEFSEERFGYFNQLADRVLKRPPLRTRFLESVRYILDHSFTAEFLESRLTYARCLLTPDLLADSSKWSTNTEYLDRVEELRTFLHDRRVYVESVLESNDVFGPQQ